MAENALYGLLRGTRLPIKVIHRLSTGWIVAQSNICEEVRGAQREGRSVTSCNTHTPVQPYTARLCKNTVLICHERFFVKQPLNVKPQTASLSLPEAAYRLLRRQLLGKPPFTLLLPILNLASNQLQNLPRALFGGRCHVDLPAGPFRLACQRARGGQEGEAIERAPSLRSVTPLDNRL
jgi:hypothetical protein